SLWLVTSCLRAPTLATLGTVTSRTWDRASWARYAPPAGAREVGSEMRRLRPVLLAKQAGLVVALCAGSPTAVLRGGARTLSGLHSPAWRASVSAERAA